jgi:hypothetical protein
MQCYFLKSHQTIAHQLLQVDPPWRNWLARLTVIRITRLIAYQEVESSSLSGGDNNFFSVCDSLLCAREYTTLICAVDLLSSAVFSQCRISFCSYQRPVSTTALGRLQTHFEDHEILLQ